MNESPYNHPDYLTQDILPTYNIDPKNRIDKAATLIDPFYTTPFICRILIHHGDIYAVI